MMKVNLIGNYEGPCRVPTVSKRQPKIDPLVQMKGHSIISLSRKFLITKKSIG
jgi:hypothetical protein